MSPPIVVASLAGLLVAGRRLLRLEAELSWSPQRSRLVWRGLASKTLDMSKDPDKNYRTLEKAMAKLFKNYPPGVDKTK